MVQRKNLSLCSNPDTPTTASEATNSQSTHYIQQPDVVGGMISQCYRPPRAAYIISRERQRGRAFEIGMLQLESMHLVRCQTLKTSSACVRAKLGSYANSLRIQLALVRGMRVSALKISTSPQPFHT